MKSENLISGGTILKTHGFEGAVVVKAESWLADKIIEDEPVFLEVEGKPVPFFPEWVDGAGATLIIKFDGYDSTGSMTEFVGCKILCQVTSDRSKEKHLSPEILKGFMLLSDDGMVKSVITGFIDTGFQLILQAEFNGREILIPFHEDLVVNFDEEKREIVLRIPEGLVDINN